MSVAAARLRPRGRVELEDYPVDAAWSGDAQSLALGGGAGAVRLLSVGSLALSEPIGRHPGGVLALAWQKAGRLFASSGQDGMVQLWDARALQGRRIHESAQWSEQLGFSDNGRLLAVATGRTLRIFDDRGEPLHVLAEHPGSIAAIAWRPKCAEIAAAGNGGARLHRLAPLAAAASPEARDYPLRGACLTASWNAEGRVLAAGMQDGSVQLWHVAAGTRSQLEGMGARVFATEWSASGRYLATAAGSALVVWDLGGKDGAGARAIELKAHSERISALRFRPSGTWLVSAARDRRLLLWRVGATEEPVDAHLLPQDCTLLRFSRDGALLAVGDARGGITLYDCP